MTDSRYPRIRRQLSNGFLILQESVALSYFILRPHKDISDCVIKALGIYLQTVGQDKLRWYTDAEGEGRPLDEAGWAFVHDKLRGDKGWPLDLWESNTSVGSHRFEYRARASSLQGPTLQPDAVCGVSFWLPTEYLESRGPAQVKALAERLARELPFNTGYTTLALNTLSDQMGISHVLRELCERYPGMDLHKEEVTMRLGTRPKGSYWLNFYGQPLLGQLGGVAALGERLTLPGISVQQLSEDKVLVELGEWPEVDGEMPSYRQLARVLEPHLYQETIPLLEPEEMRRWERRFLD